MKNWDRKYYTETSGKPFLYYIVFGAFKDLDLQIPPKYNSYGLMDELSFQLFEKDSHKKILNQFCVGYLWDRINQQNTLLAKLISESQASYIIKGEINDQPDLNYFRDVIGLITYLLENGGVCTFDPQMFKWWPVEEWKKLVFDENEPNPLNHVVILSSAQKKGEWLHTRGMRKFGRPDISMKNVDSSIRLKVIEMFERFIEFQAFGGIIEKKQEIHMQGLPNGLKCYHKGTVNDPDFNNSHIEIK